MISAEIVKDSVSSKTGTRLTTFELIYPRFIHAELMTHRVFSRNASSSRAVPIDKVIEDVRNNPINPVFWGKNQSGMSATEEIDNVIEAQQVWNRARESAILHAETLKNLKVHKQLVNRILEPFAHIHTLVTSTDYENFFRLRIHPAAQPEMCSLATLMELTLSESRPQKLSPGQWHMPYVDGNNWKSGNIECSVARCARVSYLNNTKTDEEKDMHLYEKLKANKHFSPFEHQATPMFPDDDYGVTHITKNGVRYSGNFKNFVQYRQTLRD